MLRTRRRKNNRSKNKIAEKQGNMQETHRGCGKTNFNENWEKLRNQKGKDSQNDERKTNSEKNKKQK